MIETLHGFSGNVLALACKGHVTRQDYETVLVPAVQKALGEHPKLRLYYEIGSDFTGIDPGAVWEDFKVGFAHLTRWERVAVVTDVEWIGRTIQIFGFLIPGKVNIFPRSAATEARAWIASA